MDDHGADLRWAAVAAAHHIVDYYVLEKNPNASRNDLQTTAMKFRQDAKLEQLGRIADAFKHGVKIEKDKSVAFANSTKEDFFSIPNVFDEPNIYAISTIVIDGRPVSVNVTLKAAIDFWSNKLKP